MCNSDVYKRISTLLKDMGICLENGSINKAEIMAYTSAILMISDYFERIFDVIFINLPGNDNISRYAELADIDLREYSVEEAKAIIFSLLGSSFRLYDKNELETAAELVGGLEYETNDSNVIFRNVDYAILKRLELFLRRFVPVTTTAKCTGTGLSFDEWESVAKPFEELDRLRLPISIIESLGCDNFE